MNIPTPQLPELVAALRLVTGAARHVEARALVIERQPDITYTLEDRVRQQRIRTFQMSSRTIATQVLNNLPRQVSQLLTTLNQVLQMVETRCTLAEDSPARLPFCKVLDDEITVLVRQHTTLLDNCRILKARADLNRSGLRKELDAVLEQLGDSQAGHIGMAADQVQKIENALSASIRQMLESSQDLGQTLGNLAIGSIDISTPAQGAKPAVSGQSSALSLQVLGQVSEQFQQVGQGRETFRDELAQLRQAYQTLARHNASAASIQAVLMQIDLLGQALEALCDQLLYGAVPLNALKYWTQPDVSACKALGSITEARETVAELKHLLSSLNLHVEADFSAS